MVLSAWRGCTSETRRTAFRRIDVFCSTTGIINAKSQILTVVGKRELDSQVVSVTVSIAGISYTKTIGSIGVGPKTMRSAYQPHGKNNGSRGQSATWEERS
jgi:hypothetical protein